MNNLVKTRRTCYSAIVRLVLVASAVSSDARTEIRLPTSRAARVTVNNPSVFSIPAGQPALPRTFNAVAGPAVAIKPTVPLIAPAVLFSQYLSDPRIRALASARFTAHHTLTRADMLDIL